MKWVGVIGGILFCLGASASVPSAESTSQMARPAQQASWSTENFGGRSVGHNVSPTTTTLKKHEVSVGTFFLGYGLNDNWLVATSPFVTSLYQMYNLAVRTGWDVAKNYRLLIGTEYFKTYGPEAPIDQKWRTYCSYPQIKSRECKSKRHPSGFTSFKMEAWDLKLTLSRQFQSRYRLNVTASYYHYIDDERPFSLRMDPQNDDAYAMNLTTLHELRLSQNIYLNLEAGVWGFNYTYPYLHYGSTLNFQTDDKSGLIAFGASVTQSLSFPQEKAIKFNGYDSRQAIHPEVQVQYYF